MNAVQTSLRIEHFVGFEQQGQYLTIPFSLPPGVESFTLTLPWESIWRKVRLDAPGTKIFSVSRSELDRDASVFT